MQHDNNNKPKIYVFSCAGSFLYGGREGIFSVQFTFFKTSGK